MDKTGLMQYYSRSNESLCWAHLSRSYRPSVGPLLPDSLTTNSVPILKIPSASHTPPKSPVFPGPTRVFLIYQIIPCEINRFQKKSLLDHVGFHWKYCSDCTGGLSVYVILREVTIQEILKAWICIKHALIKAAGRLCPNSPVTEKQLEL